MRVPKKEPPMSDSVTIKILKEIRDEARITNQRLDSTNERLDSTNGRLDLTNERLERLERRQVSTEVRLATELVSVVSAINELRDTFVVDRELRKTVVVHGQRLDSLDAQMQTLRPSTGQP